MTPFNLFSKPLIALSVFPVSKPSFNREFLSFTLIYRQIFSRTCRNKRKRERDNESESSDAFSREQDEEPDTGLPRNLRSLLLPDIDVPKRSDTTSNFIFPKSHATNERIDRLGDSTKQYFEQRTFHGKETYDILKKHPLISIFCLPYSVSSRNT